MVTVVLRLEPLHRFVEAQTLIFRQFADGTVKHREQLILGDAAKGFITGIHTDVIGLVEAAEYAHLGEFRHTGKEDEAKIGIGRFEDSVEALQQFAVIILKFPRVSIGSPDDYI